MGEVYRAIDSVLERPVAVKLLSELYARDDESRARFQREALAAARLSRERNVVTVFDVGEHYGRPLIVMEYVDGGSVNDRLVEGSVSREQALDWLEQVAHALDRAHAHGIVHRDVKPGNLLLDSEGNVRVSDFGIASAAGLETVTLPGTVLGTAGYISPEQARGEPATPASDRYSLGVIAFELLTGRRPFEGDTAVTEAFAHANAAVPSATRLDPSLPPGVDEVLARALAKDPADRPASCAELVADLRAAIATADGHWPAPVAAVPDGDGRTTVRMAAPPTRVREEEPPSAPRRDRHVSLRPLGSALGSRYAAFRVALRDVFRRPRPRPQAIALLAAAVLIGGVTGFALLGFGDATLEREAAGNGTPPATTTETTPTETTPTDTEPVVDGAALNAQGWELAQAGRFPEALPILRQAVGALRATNTLDEAFASYNLAFTRFALGSCSGVIGLLDRSERIQGDREEIDRLREQWDAQCGGGEGGVAGGDEGDGRPGKGRGRGNGGGDD
jgi:serine/threonine-protein kinase